MSSNRPPVPEPSEIAGRYQVVTKLGAGAFGTVYKAKDKILGRMVAIKTIRLEGLAAAGASLDELMDRFKREAQVSAQLKHPNIVTIYDIGDADGLSYLAMEFIDGAGLEKIIASAGKLPLERAALIGAQVADALDFAHKHSVVHRDIKPANIMIEAGDRVKVTDFGIAKVTNSGDHLTMTGSLLGTPSYMSPEQARGAELDGRSDLFAVGCVLYEMLIGKKAFRGESITGLIFKIITEEPAPIRELDPNIPEEAARIITKALSKAPDTRYQSGRELADDLQALVRPGTTPTVRQVELPTTMLPPQGPARSSASPVPADAPPTFAAPATLAGTAPTQAKPRPVPPPVPPPAPPPAAARPRPPASAAAAPPAGAARRSGSGAGLLIGLGLVGLLMAGAAATAAWYFFLRKPDLNVADVRTTEQRTTEPPATTAPAVTTPPATVPAATEPPTTTPPRVEPTAPTPEPRPSVRASTPPRVEEDAPANRREPPPVTRPATAEPPPGRSGAGEFWYLDREPPEEESEGARNLEGYRNRPGSGASGFGGGIRVRQRDRSPRGLGPGETPAVATIRHVINAEEIYQHRNNRYATLEELVRAGALRLDVTPQAKAFVRRNYRFELTIEEDGFKVIATPIGGGARAFVGDDTGVIRSGVD